jgi:hypothetical protein
MHISVYNEMNDSIFEEIKLLPFPSNRLVMMSGIDTFG